MLLISHRGNINGKNPNRENHPDYINEALDAGFDVEIDVWFEDGHFYLGHDEPLYEVEAAFLQNARLWCHAKHIEALFEMLKDPVIHCFYHEHDPVTLTSQNYIWTFPGAGPLGERSIVVMPEQSNYTDEELKESYGLCSDCVSWYQNLEDKPCD